MLGPPPRVVPLFTLGSADARPDSAAAPRRASPPANPLQQLLAQAAQLAAQLKHRLPLCPQQQRQQHAGPAGPGPPLASSQGAPAPSTASRLALPAHSAATQLRLSDASRSSPEAVAAAEGQPGHSPPASGAQGAGGAGGGAVTREELGRATWLLLHTLAAQLPDRPTRQQKQDVRRLVDVLTRVYPCGECAQHFQEIVREHPPAVGSGAELQQWLCRVHNIVNRSLGKPSFNCGLAGLRWGALDCGSDLACDLALGGRRP